MKDRKSGFYWIRQTQATKWEVAKYDAEYNNWYLIGRKSVYYDSFFYQIDENKINRI